VIGRRDLLKSLAGLSVAALAGCAGSHRAGAGHVVVVGGGFGGATAAKYLRLWSQGEVQVTLVERNSQFISCPVSNLVIAGAREMADITLSYAQLQSRWGVRVVHDEAVSIDPAKRMLDLSANGRVGYDHLVLSPGIDFLPELVPGLAGQEERIPHAWKAGPQTTLLRRQLEAMPDGGVFALHIPKAPYRCPPGPYERACLVAHYLKTTKPRSKVLVLDSNDEIQSKKALFTRVFAETYKNILEYRPNSELREVDASGRTAVLDFDKVRADVLNVIPPQRAGRVVDLAGAPLINGRWADIDWLTMQARGLPGVHVLGDAIFPAAAMPKSGHMANQHAKLAAAAILNALAGLPPNPQPVVMNTCYSFVEPGQAIHVASVHQYDGQMKTMQPVKNAGGVSAAPSEAEGRIAQAWARNIWADMLA
jgi:sulfide dehydrogenase [flavocytochrome c] flavoprotein chain